jgi:citrate lyase beta subunit
VKIYQYLPLAKPRAITRMLNSVYKSNALSVLDLEDSSKDFMDLNITRSLKKEARIALEFVMNFNYDSTDIQRFAIRINSPKTEFYKYDVLALNKIINKNSVKSIWVPMVDSVDDLITISKDFSSFIDCGTKIVPIIETVDGLNNIDLILKHKYTFKFDGIHYGHYDYSLDAGEFPLLEQNDILFLERVKRIIGIIEGYGLNYIHTPIGRLKDRDLLLGVMDWLESNTSSDFGVTALNINQSKWYGLNSEEFNIMIKNSVDHDNDIEKATWIVDQFNDNKCSGRSFSVDKKRCFITPHEYMLASNFLKTNNIG